MMFDSKTLITFLGIVSLCTAFKPDNICILLPDGTKIIDDQKCAAYYRCKGGKAISEVCPSGQYFNKEYKGCVPKSEATCLSWDDSPCDGVVGSKFAAMPYSCSGYYYCENNTAYAGECPDDLNFNPYGQSCQYKEDYGCSGKDMNDNPNLLCAYIPNGIYFGNAGNCRTWFKCVDNLVKTGNCEGFVFNVQTQKCDDDVNYDCQQLEGDKSETGEFKSEPCRSDNEIRAHPNSCSSYLVCGKGGKYVTQKCPLGLYFDAATLRCTSRQNAVNDCDRCENTMMQFVNAYHDNCEGYLICAGGRAVGRGNCGVGNYFNEIFGSCMMGNNPEFAACSNGPMLACADCEIYDPAIRCGEYCSCEVCPVELR